MAAKVLLFALVYFVGARVGALPAPVKETGIEAHGEESVDRAKVADLGEELEKLKADGVIVQKAQQTVTQEVNGHQVQEQTKEEAITDAKTGEVVATLEKTTSKVDNEPAKTETKVKLVSPETHQAAPASDKEKLIIPVDELAKYISDTDDLAAVLKYFDELVASKKLSQEQADEYFEAVAQRVLPPKKVAPEHEEPEVTESTETENVHFSNMLTIMDILGNDHELVKTLTAYVKNFYQLYKEEGDEHARDLLIEFTSSVGRAAQEGRIDPEVRDGIYNNILLAMEEVNANAVKEAESRESHQESKISTVPPNEEKSKRHGDK